MNKILSDAEAHERKLERTRNWKEKHKDMVKANNAAHYRKNKEAMVLINRRKALARYGVTIEQYEAMYRAQNGACAICHRQNISGRRLAVDHHHATGKIRGLLCSRCNTGIGQFNEAPQIMAAAINYLRMSDAASDSFA